MKNGGKVIQCENKFDENKCKLALKTIGSAALAAEPAAAWLSAKLNALLAAFALRTASSTTDWTSKRKRAAERSLSAYLSNTVSVRWLARCPDRHTARIVASKSSHDGRVCLQKPCFCPQVRHNGVPSAATFLRSLYISHFDLHRRFGSDSARR